MLKISYGSTYELMELLKNHPKEVADTHRLYAEANKVADDARMELEILIADLVAEVCESRKVPPSAKQEVRRAEIQTDIRFKKATKKLNKATADMLTLKGRVSGMFDRKVMLESLARFEHKLMYGGPNIYDNRGSDRKVNDASADMELPD